MTPSEQRLHPASIFFDTARYARLFAGPALLALVTSSRGSGPLWQHGYGGPDVETWLWVLMLPSVALSVARYLSFRMQYEPDQLVIRSGILFKNVRHLPYARIQNLDAVQNVFHRAFGVADVRVETGGGSEPEARMSVLPVAALEEMRTRVFAGRQRSAPTVPLAAGVAEAPAEEPEAGTTSELLHLPLRELLLCGFLENKGLVLVGAAYGTLFETGALNRVWSWLVVGNVDARGLLREMVAALLGRGALPLGRVFLALGGVAVFLILVRLISMLWALLRLYDFRLTRRGDDLRAAFGLLTRVTATIPLRRVQTVTIDQGWLHRFLGRASVRVETAGGQAGRAVRDREWVAPLIGIERVPQLVADILPGVALDDARWEGVHPRAFGRAVKPALVVALIVTAAVTVVIGWRGLAAAVPLAAWAVVTTRQHVRHLGWAATDEWVAFRSGWLTRSQTLVKMNRIQAVSTHASPLDRRASMARVRADTAGAGERSHGVDIPYLGADVADALRERLAVQAARTAFKW
jgi:putative membrane protein